MRQTILRMLVQELDTPSKNNIAVKAFGGKHPTLALSRFLKGNEVRSSTLRAIERELKIDIISFGPRAVLIREGKYLKLMPDSSFKEVSPETPISKIFNHEV